MSQLIELMRNALIAEWEAIYPHLNKEDPENETLIDDLAEKAAELFPNCNTDMTVNQFVRLGDNARALFTIPLSEQNPKETYTPNWCRTGMMFIHESGMPIELSREEFEMVPMHLFQAILNEDAYQYLLDAQNGLIEPSDPIGDQIKLMQEQEAAQLENDRELKHIAMQVYKAVDGGVDQTNCVPQDTLADQEKDYVTFESYLETMRKMHSYEQMPNDHKVQFDHSVAYRWRDIKALKLILASVEENDGLNALGRYHAELVRLSMLNDQAYLELNAMRNAMLSEADELEKRAKDLRKRKLTSQAQALEVVAKRFREHMRLVGPMPPEAVDVLTRMRDLLNKRDEENKTYLEQINILANEVERLRAGLEQEAKYCFDHASSNRGIDDERADRHVERGQRLLDLRIPPIKEEVKESVVEQPATAEKPTEPIIVIAPSKMDMLLSDIVDDANSIRDNSSLGLRGETSTMAMIDEQPFLPVCGSETACEYQLDENVAETSDK